MSNEPPSLKTRRKVLSISVGSLAFSKLFLGTAGAKRRPEPKDSNFDWEGFIEFLYNNFGEKEAKITIDIVEDVITKYNNDEITKREFGERIEDRIINHTGTPKSTRALTYDPEIPDSWTEKGDTNEINDGVTTSSHCGSNYRPIVFSNTQTSCEYVQSCSHSDQEGYHEAGYRTWAFGSASIEQIQRAYLGREEQGGTHRIAAEIDYQYQIEGSVSVEFWLWLIDHGSGDTYENLVYSSSVSDSGQEEISAQFYLTEGHAYSAAVYTVGETTIAGTDASVWDMNTFDRGFNIINNRIEDTLVEEC